MLILRVIFDHKLPWKVKIKTQNRFERSLNANNLIVKNEDVIQVCCSSFYIQIQQFYFCPNTFKMAINQQKQWSSGRHSSLGYAQK